MPGRTWNHPQNQVEMLAAVLRDDRLPTLPLPHSAKFEAFRRYNGHQFVDYTINFQTLNCWSIFCFTSTSFSPFWDFLRESHWKSANFKSALAQKTTLIPFFAPSKNTLIPFSTPSKNTLIPVSTPSKNTLIPFPGNKDTKGWHLAKSVSPLV